MNNTIERGIGDLCSEYYIEYGRELNANRALPLLYDGLKPSYRRAIYTALQAPNNYIKSADFVGSMLRIHPHGDKSVSGVETNLVRAKIFKELGNFGYYPIYGASERAAAPRYTATGIEDNWYDIMKTMIDMVPYMEGEVEGVLEPQYLPTCIPLSLVIGSQGIGLGINTNIPNFSAKSILDAYLHDDPSLLKPYYDLEIDYELSDLERLWNKGIGKVIYKYHVWEGYDDAGVQGVYISGDTQVFSPDWSVINEWKGQGLVFTRDETTGGKPVVFIGRNKGVRKVNQEMIYEECLRCTSTYNVFEEIQTIYRLGIHDGIIARYISMKEWVDIVYKNYLKLVDKYKKTHIKQLDFDTLVYTNLKDVASLLLNTTEDISNEDISNQLNLPIDVVNAITRKSISTLKRVDTESVLNNIKLRRKEYTDLVAEEFINSVIERM